MLPGLRRGWVFLLIVDLFKAVNAWVRSKFGNVLKLYLVFFEYQQIVTIDSKWIQRHYFTALRSLCQETGGTWTEKQRAITSKHLHHFGSPYNTSFCNHFEIKFLFWPLLPTKIYGMWDVNYFTTKDCPPPPQKRKNLQKQVFNRKSQGVFGVALSPPLFIDFFEEE